MKTFAIAALVAALATPALAAPTFKLNLSPPLRPAVSPSYTPPQDIHDGPPYGVRQYGLPPLPARALPLNPQHKHGG